jgi:HNH endonuclease
MGLDVSHFRGQGHLRGTASPQRKSPTETLVHRPDLKYRADSARIKRALLDLGVPEECARCGIGPEWQGEPMSLQVDHISGDFRDNRQENLRLLCPNCHATTNNYCRKKRIG